MGNFKLSCVSLCLREKRREPNNGLPRPPCPHLFSSGGGTFWNCGVDEFNRPDTRPLRVRNQERFAGHPGELAEVIQLTTSVMWIILAIRVHIGEVPDENHPDDP